MGKDVQGLLGVFLGVLQEFTTLLQRAELLVAQSAVGLGQGQVRQPFAPAVLHGPEDPQGRGGILHRVPKGTLQKIDARSGVQAQSVEQPQPHFQA